MTHWPHRPGKRLNAVIASVCVIAILVIWLSTQQRIASERKQAVAAAMESNSNLAIAFEQQVFRTLMAAEQVASFVREQYLRQGRDMGLQRLVEEGLIRDMMFTIISVVNEDGDIVDSSHPFARVNYADRDFFRAQRNSDGDKLFVNGPVMGRVSGEWRIPMSLRISNQDGSFGGVVVMSIDPISLTGFYRQANLGA